MSCSGFARLLLSCRFFLDAKDASGGRSSEGNGRNLPPFPIVGALGLYLLYIRVYLVFRRPKDFPPPVPAISLERFYGTAYICYANRLPILWYVSMGFAEFRMECSGGRSLSALVVGGKQSNSKAFLNIHRAPKSPRNRFPCSPVVIPDVSGKDPTDRHGILDALPEIVEEVLPPPLLPVPLADLPSKSPALPQILAEILSRYAPRSLGASDIDYAARKDLSSFLLILSQRPQKAWRGFIRCVKRGANVPSGGHVGIRGLIGFLAEDGRHSRGRS